MKKGKFINWLVRVRVTTWNGKTGTRSVVIRAAVNEWQAQSLALLKCSWEKGYGGHWRRAFSVAALSADHAIQMIMTCEHGCCAIDRGPKR